MLTERVLNRTTLQRQMLLERQRMPVPEAVRRLVALQAQHPASPYVALWNRLDPFDPADVDAAFLAHELVKATLMRLTLHAVHADDYGPFREMMDSRIRTGWIGEERFQHLTQATGGDMKVLIADLLAFTEVPRTGTEVEAWIQTRWELDPDPELMPMVRAYAPLMHAPLGHTWMYGPRPNWQTPRIVPRLGDEEAEQRGIARFIRRFLTGFGPATIPDMATFTVLKRTTVREVLATMDDLVQLAGPGRAPYYDLQGLTLADEHLPAPPRLMAMWDSALMTNHDRSRLIPPAYRKIVVRPNGDFLPTLLVDGQVAGVWRTVDGQVEARSFAAVPEDAWTELGREARSLLAMLADRDPGVYRRYDHWWKRLPEGETRLLPAD